MLTYETRDLALASMARDDPPASSTASSTAAVLLAARRPQCAVKWDRNLKPKLAIIRQCSLNALPSKTDGQTDGHWHRSISAIMYILHLALKIDEYAGVCWTSYVWVLYKLTARWSTLVYVLVRRGRRKMLCMHKTFDVALIRPALCKL